MLNNFKRPLNIRNIRLKLMTKRRYLKRSFLQKHFYNITNFNTKNYQAYTLLI